MKNCILGCMENILILTYLSLSYGFCHDIRYCSALLLTSKYLFLMWGAHKLLDSNISRRAHKAGSGIPRTPICIYKTRSTRPNYIISFAQKP